MSRKRENTKKNRFFFLVAIILLIYFSTSFSRGFLAIKRIKEETKKTQERIEIIASSNKKLEEEIRLLKTYEYIERLAREQLGMVKEGEISVILIEEE